MTRWLVMVGLVLGSGVLVDEAAAGMASIVTVTPVAEGESQEGVEAAASALRRAVRGAQAMGLDDMVLKSIRLVPGAGVVVEILASESGDAAAADSDLERSRLEGAAGSRL
jgi:hypothetical protein